MMRWLIRTILFRLDPERAHRLTFTLLAILNKIPGMKRFLTMLYQSDSPKLKRELFGLTFAHPVGLAAGFDKDAKAYEMLAALGFSFIEVGTLTPKAQGGNPKKRLFRLVEDEAIINRMGFNNEGVEAAKLRLMRNRGVLIGGNIGKNRKTPNYLAAEDYIMAFNELFDYVDYFVVNVSSPNTPNLRALQERAPLTALLNRLQEENHRKEKRKPILLKIAPDLTDGQLHDIIAIVKESRIDGVIATNTTLSREGLRSINREEAGGLSGRPLAKRSTEVIRFLVEESNHAFPVIGVGGIHSAKDALEKLDAGASLIQLYSGFIYEGPRLIQEINRAILKEEEGQIK